MASTVFVLNWASKQAVGYGYELDIKRPGSALWQAWKTATLKSGLTADRGPAPTGFGHGC